MLGAPSGDFRLNVLRAVHPPLSRLLRFFSPTGWATRFPPLLICASHPSVDRSRLPQPRPRECIRAAPRAELPRYPRYPRYPLAPPQPLPLWSTPFGKLDNANAGPPGRTLEHVLCTLLRLTMASMWLLDTTCTRRACADALAAALPTLPLLTAPHASGNCLNGVFDALAAALPSAVALSLQLLVLDDAACTSQTMRSLASALHQMPTDTCNQALAPQQSHQ